MAKKTILQQTEVTPAQVATVTIPAGTIGLDFDTTRREAPKYRFNATVEAAVVGEHTVGCDEHARQRLIVLVEGKHLSVTK